MAENVALAGPPHANNPAGWANQLWDWWWLCVLKCLLAAYTWVEGELGTNSGAGRHPLQAVCGGAWLKDAMFNIVTQCGAVLGELLPRE